jgi:predicted nuclease of restriction endonuclease-like (RecB) superfamily
MNKDSLNGYGNLLGEIKQRIRSAQYKALRAVNRELIALYWDIGRMIVERQKLQGWGKSVVERLAADLQAEFPGVRGFSERNIRYMRKFYSTYSGNEKLQPLVAEISWTHNILIMEKCKDDLKREFYLRMTREQGWSKNALIHNIENQAYERTLLGQSNYDTTLPEEARYKARLALKDDYSFDFLDLGDQFSERRLESEVISRIEPFLREMGGVFAFISSQFRLEVSGREFFVDLLLYHRRLKCLVAVELKVGEFVPEYVGKMQFYLALLDDRVHMEDENPAIGIILCKDKDRTIVEYALRESRKPIGVSSYQMVRTLPDELQGELPAPEQVAMLMKEI